MTRVQYCNLVECMICAQNISRSSLDMPCRSVPWLKTNIFYNIILGLKWIFYDRASACVLIVKMYCSITINAADIRFHAYLKMRAIRYSAR